MLITSHDLLLGQTLTISRPLLEAFIRQGDLAHSITLRGCFQLPHFHPFLLPLLCPCLLTLSFYMSLSPGNLPSPAVGSRKRVEQFFLSPKVSIIVDYPTLRRKLALCINDSGSPYRDLMVAVV
jgi:hypothetical protein